MWKRISIKMHNASKWKIKGWLLHQKGSIVYGVIELTNKVPNFHKDPLTKIFYYL